MNTHNKLLLRIKPPLDFIIHLGAGKCSELDDYLTLNPKNIQLIEADSDLVKELELKVQNNDNVTIIPCAISATEEHRKLFRYNISSANGIHPATELKLLFPGLKQLEPIKVKSIRPTELLQPLALNIEQNNLLVVDVPGEELAVLQALEEADKLVLFRYIQLHCGIKALYSESHTADSVINWLNEHGYHVKQIDNSNSSYRPVWLLEVDTLKLENYQQRLAINRLTVDKQKQLEQSNKEKQQLLTLASERQHQIEKLTQERDTHAKTATEKQQQLEQSNQEKQQQVTLASERQHQIEKLTQERDTHAKTAIDKQKRLQQDLDEARQTVALSIKLQALKEADLKDLQQRYQESQETQQQQHELLDKLTEKLTIAADYFHQIEKQDAQQQEVERIK
jgi:FkbM family methyltransferase